MYKPLLSMRTILITVAATALYISGTNGKQQFTKKNFHARQAEAAKRHFHPQERGRTVKNITFSNPKASG